MEFGEKGLIFSPSLKILQIAKVLTHLDKIPPKL